MIFHNLLFCTNLVLYAITVCESSDATVYRFKIWNGTSPVYEELTTEYSFEEGLAYIVTCERFNAQSLNHHWEVEPYGLKSKIYYDDSYSSMSFKLHRDDQIKISCFSKSRESHTSREENRTTTFVWNKIVKPSSPPPPTSASDVLQDSNYELDADEKHKCYQKNNTTKCAYFLYDKITFTYVDLQIYTRKNHDNKSLIQDDINGIFNDDNEPNKNVNGIEKPPNVKPTKDSTESVKKPKKEIEDKRTNVTSCVPQKEVEGFSGTTTILIVIIVTMLLNSILNFIIYKVWVQRRRFNKARELDQGLPNPTVDEPYYETVDSPNDVSLRAPCPLPAEELEENKKYVHYDTPYEWRIWRLGVNTNRRAQPPRRRPVSQDIQ